MNRFVFFVCCLFALFACSENAGWEDELMLIKQRGDVSPKSARASLDSLSDSLKKPSEHFLMTSELLRIRLDDKADIMPQTDAKVKQLVAYFEHKGSDVERQEAHYYAGSTYRDLLDTPRALEHFLQAMKIAEQAACCDSIMLRNTYSNLSYLFNSVQDNQNYLKYAQKEYQISLNLHRLENTSIIHLATAYHHVDSSRLALQYFDEALLRQRSAPVSHELYILLDFYSLTQNLEQADECMSLLEAIDHESLDSKQNMALLTLGRYYQMKGDDATAIDCYEKVMTRGSNLEEMYDASRRLVTMYHEAGNAEKENRYAVRFVQLCDTLNLGKRQEMAATVNNLYRYQRDKDEEQQIMQESERYKLCAIAITLFALLTLLVGGLLYERKKNRMMQGLLSLSCEMTELKEEKEKLLEEIERQKQQNSTFIRLLHQSDFESKAEDIFSLLKRAAEGRHSMTTENWRQLYQAVDEEHPSFRATLLQHLGEFTDQQMQVCYLLRIGMAKPDIQHITNLSRVTVWRWTKRFEWAEREE